MKKEDVFSSIKTLSKVFRKIEEAEKRYKIWEDSTQGLIRGDLSSFQKENSAYLKVNSDPNVVTLEVNPFGIAQSIKNQIELPAKLKFSLNIFGYVDVYIEMPKLKSKRDHQCIKISTIDPSSYSDQIAKESIERFLTNLIDWFDYFSK